MHAAVVRGSFRPGELDAGVAALAGHELAALAGEPGYRGAVLLGRRDIDVAIVVSLWEDELRARRALERDLFPSTADGVSPLLAPAQRSDYNVALAAGGHGARAARVVTARLRPGAAEETIARFRNIVLYTATSQLNFRRGLLLVNPVRASALSVGMWMSRDDIAATESSGYLANQVAAFGDVLATPPDIETFEVLLEDWL